MLLRKASVTAFFCLGFAGLGLAQPADLYIHRARIVDGAGNPWFYGDLAVSGDRITYVGPTKPKQEIVAKQVVEAEGLVLAPGFIDTHSHGRYGIFAVPGAENQIRQGVTTILEGPDGSSPFPIGEFLARFGKSPNTTNFGLLVGQGTIREKVVGLNNRPASPEELARMKAMVAQAMQEGAFGLSTGLFYVPGAFTPTEEIVALAKVAGDLGGVYTSHMRNEASQILAAVKETIRIGEESGIPVQVTHHKVIGRQNWGLSKQTLELVDAARKRGVDVTVDQYPYTASSTSLAALFPKWALEGGQKAFLERANAPEARARMRAEIALAIETDRGAGDPKNVVVASCGFDRSLAGKTLAEITRAKGLEVNFSNAAETAIAMQVQGGCSCIYHAIAEEDVVRILQYPWTMVASDGSIPVFQGADVPHPRSYGTFARVLGRYVREKQVISLEDAVRRMTSLPAARFRITDRGLLRPGLKADLVLFDPAKIIDKSEFGNPHQYAEGVHSVWVNGTAVLQSGKVTGATPGRALYGPAHRPAVAK